MGAGASKRSLRYGQLPCVARRSGTGSAYLLPSYTAQQWLARTSGALHYCEPCIRRAVWLSSTACPSTHELAYNVLIPSFKRMNIALLYARPSIWIPQLISKAVHASTALQANASAACFASFHSVNSRTGRMYNVL